MTASPERDKASGSSRVDSLGAVTEKKPVQVR